MGHRLSYKGALLFVAVGWASTAVVVASCSEDATQPAVGAGATGATGGGGAGAAAGSTAQPGGGGGAPPDGAADASTDPVSEQPQGPFFVRVTRAEVVGAEPYDYELLKEHDDLPYSLAAVIMQWDVTSGLGTDSCTNNLPGSVSVTAVTEDPAGGLMEYEVTGLGHDFGDDDVKKACVVTLFGDANRCEGAGGERDYGVGVWVVKFNAGWGAAFCADGGDPSGCASHGNYAKTMKVEHWLDTDEDCTIDNPGDFLFEPYVDGDEWDPAQKYRIRIEFN